MGKVGVNGRKLRRGLLYRSAKIHGLTDGDKELLKQMSIKFVADFRSMEEVQREPDSFAAGHTPACRIFSAVDGDPHALMRKIIKEGGYGDGWASAQLKEINQNFVKVHAPVFRAFLEALVQTD